MAASNYEKARGKNAADYKSVFRARSIAIEAASESRKLKVRRTLARLSDHRLGTLQATWSRLRGRSKCEVRYNDVRGGCYRCIQADLVSHVTIRIVTTINSDTLYLPQLQPLVGKSVEIIVREKALPTVTAAISEWSAVESAVKSGLENYDFDAYCDARKAEIGRSH